MYNQDTAGTQTGCMLRSLPGTVPDSNFSLDVVEMMHDGSRMLSKKAPTVTDICQYIMSLPGTVPDSNFSLDVVEVMHDGSRMLSKKASTVSDICKYTMYVYFYSIYRCDLHYST